MCLYVVLFICEDVVKSSKHKSLKSMRRCVVCPQLSGLQLKSRHVQCLCYWSQSLSSVFWRSLCLLEFFTTWRENASPAPRGFLKVFASVPTTCSLVTTSAGQLQSQSRALYTIFYALCITAGDEVVACFWPYIVSFSHQSCFLDPYSLSLWSFFYYYYFLNPSVLNYYFDPQCWIHEGIKSFRPLYIAASHTC